ncbi:MAG: hypothetical protein WA655_20195 [Candidatus Korobacteraceae bacterium]
MRRTLASLLLLFSMAGLALPFVQAQHTAPACCLRGGQHHCNAPLPGDGFHAHAAPCPYLHFTALTSHSLSLLNVPLHAFILGATWHDSLPFHSPDITRHVAGNAYKRGPPPA